MRKIVLFISILVFANVIASAQLKKYRWDTEFCTFEGTYDARKITLAELKNTLRLYTTMDFDLDTFKATVFKYENIGALRSVESLEAEYKQKSDALQKLDIADTPFWTEFRQKKLKSLEQQYQLARVSVQAYRQPTVLKELNFADACVQRFAPPLIAGGDGLLGIWREINIEAQKNNADPERVRKEFETQMASADKFKFAQVEVITFGWWNCANAQIEHLENYEEVIRNYDKLFKNVRKINCDEP